MRNPQNAIDLRHLRYFIAVSDELHFRRAAERLHISQPPLSQAIRKLEDELGVQLLSRTSRVVTLTPAGRVFAEEASKVLVTLDRAVAEARRAGGAGAALRIGCVPYLPLERLLRFVGELHERDPNSHTEITHLSTLEQVRRLRNGELDLGIFYDAEGYEDLEIEPIFAGEPLAAFLSHTHHLAAKQILRPDDLREEAVVTLPRALNPGLHDRMLTVVEQAGFSFRCVREVDSTNVSDLLLAVADGAGVALLPLSFRDADEAGRIVIRRALKPPPSMTDTIVAWPANAPRQQRMVLATVREVARDLRQGHTSMHRTAIETEPILERGELILDSPFPGVDIRPTGNSPSEGPVIKPALRSSPRRQVPDEGAEDKAGSGAKEKQELSVREREILRLLAEGKSNEEIGKTLFISADTVRTYIRRAMKKLEADTRTQAVAIAIRHSLIP